MYKNTDICGLIPQNPWMKWSQKCFEFHRKRFIKKVFQDGCGNGPKLFYHFITHYLSKCKAQNFISIHQAVWENQILTCFAIASLASLLVTMATAFHKLHKSLLPYLTDLKMKFGHSSFRDVVPTFSHWSLCCIVTTIL